MKRSSKKYIYIFISLFLFWLILAPSFSQTSLIAGALSTLLVILYCKDILFSCEEMPLYSIRKLLMFLNYVFPFLLIEIFKANIDVMRIVLHPKLPIDPVITRVPMMLNNKVNQVIYANSVTMTPGTLSIDITEKEFVVHALTRKAAEGLIACVIEQHTCRIDRLSSKLEDSED